MSVYRVILGFIVSMLVGHLFISMLLEKILWPRTNHGYKTVGLTWLVGVIERFLFTGALIFGAPQCISIWLGLKVIARWQSHDKKKELSCSQDIWLIGSGLSVLFGFLGAWIALGTTALKASLK